MDPFVLEVRNAAWRRRSFQKFVFNRISDNGVLIFYGIFTLCKGGTWKGGSTLLILNLEVGLKKILSHTKFEVYRVLQLTIETCRQTDIINEECLRKILPHNKFEIRIRHTDGHNSPDIKWPEIDMSKTCMRSNIIDHRSWRMDKENINTYQISSQSDSHFESYPSL